VDLVRTDVSEEHVSSIFRVEKSKVHTAPHPRWRHYSFPKTNSVALVCERTIPSSRLPFVGEVVPIFADRVCRVISSADPYVRILGFLHWSLFYLFEVVRQLYSRGWVETVTDPLLLRKSGSAGNRTRTSGAVARNPDH
jgi:hypothetical protein